MKIKVPAPTLLDRAISYVSPQRGLQRLHARTMQEMALGGAYSSGSTVTNPRNWRAVPRSALTDQAGELYDMRGRSRELARLSPIAIGAINTNVDRVVGTGLALSAMPNGRILGWTEQQLNDWKARTQDEFAMWADSAASCDLTEVQNFDQLQALVLRSTLESGDCFSNLPDAPAATRMRPYRLRVQVLEADRVGNPGGQFDTDDVAGGIRMDSNGRPVACHLYDRHPGSLQLVGNRWAGQWVDLLGNSGRRRMLHHFDRLRPEQPRGLPYLTPVIECIKQITTYTDAEIKAAVVSSMFTVFVTTPEGDSSPLFTGGDPGQAQAQGSVPQGAPDADVAMGSGAIVGLTGNERIDFADPTRPNTAFEPFTLAVIRQIGVALGLPYELLIKQFNASYSASKAALLDAWQYLRRRRRWLALSFCQPVYETWLTEAVILGRVKAPGFFEDPLMRWAYTRAEWFGDSQGSINPKDEVAAYRDAIDARLCTRERAEWELFGTDFNRTLEAKRAEEDALRTANLTPVPKAGAAAPGGTPNPQPSGE